MATRRYLGHAAGVKQVDTITIANTWAQNDTVTLTIDNIDVVITIGTLITTAQVATTIKQAFNGETLTDTSASYTPNSGVQSIGQFAEMTASVSNSVVSLTANVAGKPFTLSVTESTVGDGTATEATSVTAVGKYHFSAQDNHSANTVPVDNDTIVFDIGSVGPQYDLTPTIQPAAVYVMQSFTGNIGLAEQNADNATYPYAEYRTKDLTFDDNSVTCSYHIGQGEGQGSSRIRFNAGAGQSKFYIYASGSREVTGVPVVLLSGSHASNELNNYDGDVGVGFYAGQSCTLAKLRNGSGPASQARTYCGAGATLSSCTIEMEGGTITTNTAISTVNMTAGELIHQNGNITTLSVWGGNWRQRTGGTITTLKVGAGLFDKSQNGEPLTITNKAQFYKGARIIDPHGTITFSAGYELVGCTEEDVEINLGFGRTYTPS